MKQKLCLALDVSSEAEARELVALTNEYVSVYKIGLELYTRYGPDIVRELRSRGAKVFLDLKLHDIPNTMEKATGAAVDLRVDYLTIHSAAGLEAMRRCNSIVTGTQLRLLAVTVLTSIGWENAHEVFGGDSGWTGFDIKEKIIPRRVEMARKAGISGLVCSAKDAVGIRSREASGLVETGRRAFLVTPGIRRQDEGADDQKQVTTPAEAIKAGSDMLVVGRSIHSAADPKRAAAEIFKEMEGAA